MFRAFLKLVIRRNYLYLPTELMNKGRAMHILLGSLEFGSQVVDDGLCLTHEGKREEVKKKKLFV